MCGFAGIVNRNEASLDTIKKIGQTIIHRGPDHTGLYWDQNVAFVHNRLSLVDLSENANQPFTDDRFVLIFNGEIYNHNQLRKDYLSNDVLKTTSDTETLFYLLKKLGVDQSTTLIRGMFTFAWYDKQTKQIWLVRDRLGIKPLFYIQQKGQLIFSSELKGITTHFDIPVNELKIQKAAMGEFEFSKTHTAFEDVIQLIPGTILHYDLEKDIVSRSLYFSIEDLVDKNYYRELHSCSEKELLLRFDQLMHKSIDSMMMSDVGMGAFVSGGVDSSLIAAIATKSNPVTLITGNNLGKHSEYTYAKSLADFLQQDLFAHEHKPEEILTKWVETTWFYESPVVVHPHAIPFHGVAKVARNNGLKCVLTGEGADELFLGYPRILTRKWDNFINLPFTLTKAIYKRIPGLTKYLNLNQENYEKILFSQAFGYEWQITQQNISNAYAFVENKKLIDDHALTLDMLSRSLHSLLWRNDRMGMMRSIEARFAYLDEDLLKFAANLPIKLKIAKTSSFNNYKHPFLIDKYILRKTAQKYLPKKLAYRNKVGFSMYGFDRINIKKGFFNNGFLENLLKLNKQGIEELETNTYKSLLWKLAAVEIWGQLHVQKRNIPEVNNLVENYTSMDVNL